MSKHRATPDASPALPRVAYSPAEVASQVGICRATVYNLIQRGEIQVVKIGRCTRIPITEVERLAGLTAAVDRLVEQAVEQGHPRTITDPRAIALAADAIRGSAA